VGVASANFDDVSILFADILGFTSLAAQMPPNEMLELLHRVFSCFDELVEQHGVEKVKTIGDIYMAAGGWPEPVTDHLNAMAKLSLQMVESAAKIRCARGPITIRLGLHVGPVITGAPGIRKPVYDVLGNTVNMASRLKDTSEPGRIHVSKVVAERLKDRFSFESRGTIEIKGLGPTDTFFLIR
jgi:adenylate cyclase